jgi:sodium/hydrogen antiporter
LICSKSWLVCAGLIYALIPGLNFLSSLAVSACLTPTDPILASAVVGGKWADKHVPAHIRHLLAAECGCNDGATFPFLFFTLYLMTDLPSVGNAMRDWFLILWLCAFFPPFCHSRDFYRILTWVLIPPPNEILPTSRLDRSTFLRGSNLSLAILTIGLTTILGCDDLLAAFACGTSFAWDGFFNKQTEESVFSSVIDTLRLSSSLVLGCHSDNFI